MNQFKKAALVFTTSYHATLASLYIGTPVVSLYENEYYNLKFFGLKEVFKTDLLNILNLENYKIDELTAPLHVKDKMIGKKLDLLKQANITAYNKYEEFLNIY